MQFHNGERLKKIIKNQPLTITEISKISEVASSSIYDLFKKPEVTPGRIRPILDVIGVSVEDFFHNSSKIENRTGKGGLVLEIENLKRENELLREQIKQQKEMILLLKKGNKK